MISHRSRFIFLFIFLIVCTPFSYSQFYDLGQDPFSKKWKQIQTEHYQIIFPEEFIDQAQRLANILDYSYVHVAATLNHSPRKISVIIHNETFYSNGSVVWAPKRMEIYTTPPQNIYPTEWLEQLVVHEARHVVQIDKMNQGITHILSFLFGEQALGAVLGLIPSWYFEGDAVVTETALSHSGRGSLPSFDMHLRALELEGEKRYSYEKATFGSYKNYVPNHYAYGYHLVAFGRINNSPDLWSNMLNYIARKPYTFYPFYFGLKKYDHSSKNKLYNASFDYFKEAWKKQSEKIEITPFEVINYRINKDFVTYKHPCFLNDSTLLVATNGLSKYHAFVSIDDNGNEKTIAKPGIRDGVTLSAANDIVVWEEYKPDPVWENRSTSVIKVLNTQTGKKQTINYQARLFSPAISPDGKIIAVIDVASDNTCALVLFDVGTGYVRKNIKMPDNWFIQIPSWTNDNEAILFTFMEKGKKGIASYHPGKDSLIIQLKPDYYNISHVKDGIGFILYQANYSGIDNIYALSKNSKTIMQITRSRYGAYYPHLSPSGTMLYYCNYTVNGFDVVKTPFQPGNWTPFEKIIDQSPKIDEKLREQESGIIESENIPMKDMEVKPYRRITHLFKIHSWLPFYFDYNDYELTLDGYDIYPGITLLSQNMLSTAFTSVGYAYFNNQHHITTNFTYKGFGPVLDVNAGYGGIPTVIKPEEAGNISKPLGNNSYYKFNIYLPINLTQGNYVTNIQPHLQLNREKNYFYNTQLNDYSNNIVFAQYAFSLYTLRRTLERDLYPKWGAVFKCSRASAPFEKQLIGSIETFQTKLYFPGFTHHHSFQLYLAYEKQKVDQYYFGSNLEFIRGISTTPTNEWMRKVSVDYAYPIIYPDINLGRVVYLKRISGRFFYDYAYYKPKVNSNQTLTAKSTGIELLNTLHFAHIIFPFNIGGRYSYLFNDESEIYEFIIRVNMEIF